MNDELKPIAVRCPCCATDLTLDRTSGRLLQPEKEAPPRADWDELVSALERGKQHAEQLFDQECAALAQQDSKRENALEGAETDSLDRPRRRTVDL